MEKMYKSITVLKGIGEKSKLYYEKLGVYSLLDLITYFPRAYEESSGLSLIDELEKDENYILEVEVLSVGRVIRAKKLSILTVLVGDKGGELPLIFYNQPYLKRSLFKGKKLILQGKTSIKNSKLVMVSPKFLTEKDLELIKEKTLLPVYRLSRKLSNKKLIAKISEAFDYVGDEILETLPDDILGKYELISYVDALKIIHFPKSYEEVLIARNRLVFEEFLTFILTLARLRSETEKIRNDFNIVESDANKDFLENLPFEPTESQMRVMEEIKSDIFSPYSMNRLIQGDVGSGKTLIAMLAVIDVVKSGYQAVVMTPTEVLANQHYASFNEALAGYGINVKLLTGSIKKSEKLSLKDDLKAGKIDVLVATHATITDDTIFNNLALVITDEQHRFGVKQRESLVNKGDRPHTLVMSATPIPRTLALILYSDMDLSINSDMPKGRFPISTYFVNTSYRDRLYAFILKEIKKGNQAYIVCAKATEDEESELIDVGTYRSMILEKFPEDVVITALHGKMKNVEKNQIMQDFVDKKIDILVSTTVVEVGIDVKDATCIVIENAERFGLSQLHQLRGRVGRSSKESYCVLVSDSDNEETKSRLEIMCETNDGFEIARRDLELRGHGDLLGIKQSGIPNFKLANIYDDVEILENAKKLANFLISSGEIEKKEYNLLREKIDKFLKNLEGFTL